MEQGGDGGELELATRDEEGELLGLGLAVVGTKDDGGADRAHRIGQENPVVVHRVVARETVEERILALQERKRSLADAAIGEGGGGAAITRDELLELLV